MFILVNMVVNDTFTFVITDIKANRVSTDFMVTMITFYTEVSKVSQSLWLRERDIMFRIVDILCLFLYNSRNNYLVARRRKKGNMQQSILWLRYSKHDLYWIKYVK